MTTNHVRHDFPWRVQVIGMTTHPRGAGVLLGERYVLTCAHVIGAEDRRVKIHGMSCSASWERTASVVPGTWVRPQGSRLVDSRDPSPDDVTLLELDRPVLGEEGGRVTLWRGSLPGSRAHTLGYPEGAPSGLPVEMELGQRGGPGSELFFLTGLASHVPWISEGFSGAGVVVDGDHRTHVIGIVLAKYVDGPARGAWLLPTEAIERRLPRVCEFAKGQRTTTLSGPRRGRSAPVAAGPLQAALTSELSHLLTSGWAGTLILPETTKTGTGWLADIVATADPYARALAPTAERGAGPDAGLPLDAVDAAYDAADKQTAEVRAYLAERFAVPDDLELTDRLLRRRPPPCIILQGVDQAAAPDELLQGVVLRLAAAARMHGLRLVLGFAGQPAPVAE
jgi:Trypsin